MLKNKNKFLFSLLILSLVIILITVVSLKINNKDKEVILKCNRVKKEIKCKISGKEKQYQVSNISMYITLPKDIKLKEVKVDSSWEGSGEDGRLELYTDTNKKDKFPIATFTIEADKKNIPIKIEKIIYYDENFKGHKINNVTKTIH